MVGGTGVRAEAEVNWKDAGKTTRARVTVQDAAERLEDLVAELTAQEEEFEE